MHSRYFVKPYEFVPPYRKKLWSHLARPFVGHFLRRSFGVHYVATSGEHHLQSSIDRGAGILLAPNHCRMADPAVMGRVGLMMHRYFYYVASFHLFQRSRFNAWRINRLGAFSVLRDAPDLNAVRACTDLVTEADRPLVIFPEGTYYRQNDRVGPLQGGVTLICPRPMKRTVRPLLIHPVAIKYWFLDDPRPALTERLGLLERAFGWRAQPRLDPIERLQRTYLGFVTLQEIEHMGQPQSGDLNGRMLALIEFLLRRIEATEKKPVNGSHAERIHQLRQSRVYRLAELADRKTDHPQLCRELDDLYLCQLLLAQSQDYLLECPTDERMAETLQRIEEDLFDIEDAVAPMGAVVQIGEAIDARETLANSWSPGALTNTVRSSMQRLLDEVVRQGRPPHWKPPRRKEKRSATHGTGHNGVPTFRRRSHRRPDRRLGNHVTLPFEPQSGDGTGGFFPSSDRSVGV